MPKNINIRKMQESDILDIIPFLKEEKINFFTNTTLNPQKISENLQRYTKNKKWERRIISFWKEQIIWSIILKNIKIDNQRAELWYWIWKDFEWKWYMSQALKLFLEYAFQEKQLERIQAIVREDNIWSIKLLEKLGFVFEWTMRNYKKKNNKFYNFHLYSILKSDFIK